MRTLALCLLTFGLLAGCGRKQEPTTAADSTAEISHWESVMQDRIDSLRYQNALEKQRAQLAYRLQLKARGWVPMGISTHSNGDPPDTLWGFPK